MPTISPDLLKEMDKLAGTDPGHVFPIIVTLRPGTAVDHFAAPGFRVTNRFEVIQTVSGSASMATIRALSTNPAVERIEEDGEVRAI